MQRVLFYGVPQGSSFGSIVALEWLGQPYQLCRIEMLQQPWDAHDPRVC
jgi:glutathione S-transferase